MRSNAVSGALLTPPVHPSVLQAARIAARVNVSPAVAGVLASIAYGQDRRDHGVMLAGLVANRTSSCMGTR